MRHLIIILLSSITLFCAGALGQEVTESVVAEKTPAAVNKTQTYYVTPLLVLAPQRGSVLTEVSFSNMISSLQVRDPNSVMTDLTGSSNQAIFKTVLGLPDSWFIGLFFNFLKSSTTTILTDYLNQKTMSSSFSSNLNDPTFNLGTRFDINGYSLVASLNSEIPLSSPRTTFVGNLKTTEQTNRNLTLGLTPVLTAFTNQLKQLIIGASLGYQQNVISRLDRTLLNGQHVATENVGGHRSFLTFFFEVPVKSNALGLQTTLNYFSPIQSTTNGIEVGQDPNSRIDGQIYYKLRFTKRYLFYPTLIYQNYLTSSRNGNQIDHNDNLNILLTSRYTF